MIIVITFLSIMKEQKLRNVTIYTKYDFRIYKMFLLTCKIVKPKDKGGIKNGTSSKPR